MDKRFKSKTDTFWKWNFEFENFKKCRFLTETVCPSKMKSEWFINLDDSSQIWILRYNDSSIQILKYPAFEHMVLDNLRSKWTVQKGESERSVEKWTVIWAKVDGPGR